MFMRKRCNKNMQQYNVDKTVYEIFLNLAVISAGGRTWEEERSSKEVMHEAIAKWYTMEAVDLMLQKFKYVRDGGIVPDTLTPDMLMNNDWKKSNDPKAEAYSGKYLASIYNDVKKFVHGACHTGYKGALTTSMEIPSGKQYDDVFEAIREECWLHREQNRVINLQKSRDKEWKKFREGTRTTAPTELAPSTVQPLSDETWMHVMMPAYVVFGDLAKEQEPNMVYKTAEQHRPKSRGGDKRPPAHPDLTAPSGSDADESGKETDGSKGSYYGRRTKRIKEVKEKLNLKNVENDLRKLRLTDAEKRRDAMDNLALSNMKLHESMMLQEMEQKVIQQDLMLAEQALASAKEMYGLIGTEENKQIYIEALSAHQAAIKEAQKKKEERVVAMTAIKSGRGSDTVSSTTSSSAALHRLGPRHAAVDVDDEFHDDGPLNRSREDPAKKPKQRGPKKPQTLQPGKCDLCQQKCTDSDDDCNCSDR